MPLVKMPDGAVVDIPDNAPPEQLQALARLQETSGGEGGGFMDNVKNVASAAYRGVTALPALIGDAASYTGAPGYQSKPGYKSLSDDVQEGTYKPKTTGQKYVASAVEGVAGNVLGPGTAPAKAAIGAASGLGAEGAAQLFGDNMLTRLLGGLAGGGLAGSATAAKTTRADMAQEALRDVRPQDLDTARQAMVEAQKAGIPINLSQAMPRDSNIDSLVSALANNRYGVKTTEMLRQQPQQVAFGMEDQMQQMPGQVRMPQVVANNAQDAATEVIRRAKANRTEEWGRAFDDSLAKLQDGAAMKVDDAVRKATEIANRLTVVKAQEAQLAGQIRKSAEIQHGKAASDYDKAVAALKQKEAAEQAEYQTRLTRFQQDTIPQNIAPVGEGMRNGQLLTDSQRGADTINSIFTNEATRDLRQGKGAIVLPDGTPAASKFAPQPPQAPVPAALPPKPELRVPDFPRQTPALQQELSAAQKAATDAKLAAGSIDQLPKETVAGTYKQLTDLAAQFPNTGKGKMLLELRDNLTHNGEFITDSRQLNEVLKSTAARLKDPNLSTSGVDAGDAKYLGQQINKLRDSWGDALKPFRDANERYSQITEGVVNPLKKSVVGRIAQRTGSKEDAEAVRAKVFGLLDNGTMPGAKGSEILTFEKRIRSLKPGPGNDLDGPAVFQDTVKTWMADKASAAAKQQGGRMAPTISTDLEKAFMGTDKATQGFKDMMVGLARSQGLKDDALLPGMQNFLKIVSATANRPSVKGIGPEGFDEIATKSALRGIGQFSVMTPIRQPVLRWMEFLKADAYKAMDGLLTTPEGVDMLKKLGKQPVMSKTAVNTINTFLATQATMADDLNPPGVTAP